MHAHVRRTLAMFNVLLLRFNCELFGNYHMSQPISRRFAEKGISKSPIRLGSPLHWFTSGDLSCLRTVTVISATLGDLMHVPATLLAPLDGRIS